MGHSNTKYHLIRVRSIPVPTELMKDISSGDPLSDYYRNFLGTNKRSVSGEATQFAENFWKAYEILRPYLNGKPLEYNADSIEFAVNVPISSQSNALLLKLRDLKVKVMYDHE